MVDLMPQNSHFDFSQEDSGRSYKTASFIWHINEGRFDCHYFTIQTYTFSLTDYQLVSTYTTQNKYNIDPQWTGADCSVWNIHQAMP